VNKVKFPFLSVLFPVLLLVVAVIAQAGGYQLLFLRVIPVNGLVVAAIALVWLVVVLAQWVRARQAPSPAVPVNPAGPDQGAPVAPQQEGR